MKRVLLPFVAVAAASVAAGCGPRNGPDAERLFAYGARVEYRTADAGRGWLPGVVGTVGRCRVVLAPSPPPPARAERFTPVPVDRITSLRVDSLSLQASAPASHRGPRRDDARWIDLPVDALRRRFGGCDPLG